MKHIKKLVQRLHYELSTLTATYPGIMWATMILDVIVIVLMILAGVDALVCPQNMSPFRMATLGYGIANAIFCCTICLFNVCEPEECEYSTKERLEHYQKVLAPMIILFPVLAPMWIGLVASVLVTGIGFLIYSAYKGLESRILDNR